MTSFIHHLPPEGDGNNPGAILSYLQESGLRQVEVLQRGIAPPTIVVGECVIGRTEVSSSDGDGAAQAPPWVVIAPHLVARAAAQPIVEQRRAQRRRVCAIALAV